MASETTTKKKPNRWNEVPKQNKTTVRVNAAERRRKALELRMRGYSFQEIADELGYGSKGSAHNAVMGELKSIPREAAEQAREAELTRLDALQRAVMNQALAGDPLAVDRALKVVQERSKLLGLYDLGTSEDPEAKRTRDALTEFLQAAKEAVTPSAPKP